VYILVKNCIFCLESCIVLYTVTQITIVKQLWVYPYNMGISYVCLFCLHNVFTGFWYLLADIHNYLSRLL